MFFRVQSMMLMMILGLSTACGSDKGSGGGSSNSNQSISFLLTNEHLSDACRGVYNQDVPANAEDWQALERAFATGDIVVLRSTAGGFGYDAYYSNGQEQGAITFKIDNTHIDVSCEGYVTAVVALSDVTLYSDEAYTTEACSFTAGEVYRNVSIRSYGAGYNTSDDSYDAQMQFNEAVGTCPATTELYYPAVSTNIEISPNNFSVEAAHRLVQVALPAE